MQLSFAGCSVQSCVRENPHIKRRSQGKKRSGAGQSMEPVSPHITEHYCHEALRNVRILNSSVASTLLRLFICKWRRLEHILFNRSFVWFIPFKYLNMWCVDLIMFFYWVLQMLETSLFSRIVSLSFSVIPCTQPTQWLTDSTSFHASCCFCMLLTLPGRPFSPFQFKNLTHILQDPKQKWSLTSSSQN